MLHHPSSTVGHLAAAVQAPAPQAPAVSQLERIYRDHAATLVRVIGRILLEREATLDCLQEMFLTLPRRLAHFDRRCSLGTWLHRVAVRMALDELRRRRRRVLLSRWLRPLMSRESERPELTLIRSETTQRLIEALHHEPPLDRAVLVLTSVEGLGYAEAAATLGISVESLRGRHKRIRARLRERLGHD